MPIPTVRLSEHARQQALSGLKSLVNNVVRFVDCPVSDRATILALWHAQFPQVYVEAHETLTDFGLMAGGSTVNDNMRLAVVIDDKVYSVLINIAEMPPELPATQKLKSPLAVVPKLRQSMHREVRFDSSRTASVTVEIADIHKFFGEQADDFLRWVVNSAKLYDEIETSIRVLDDVLSMAKSAGQVKRMVPDLVQYLPEHIREAFADQKRSSTTPFEWPTYPKRDVEVMLATVNKGHLLVGMAKPNRNDWTHENIAHHTWSRHAEWAN